MSDTKSSENPPNRHHDENNQTASSLQTVKYHVCIVHTAQVHIVHWSLFTGTVDAIEIGFPSKALKRRAICNRLPETKRQATTTITTFKR